MQNFYFQELYRIYTLTSMHIFICIMFLIRTKTEKRTSHSIALKNSRYIYLMEYYASEKMK